MAACAYGAVALSEELHPAINVGALVGMIASWFWEPPRVRPERWSAWWNAAALAAFGYTVLSSFAGSSWITGGTQLLLFLLVAKLFNRRSSRDYQWVYVVSFLLLVAATTLNAELSYAVCFLGYVVFATWALILFHLRREMEDNFLLKHSDESSWERVEVDRILNSRRIVGGKFLAVTSTVSLVIFLASALLFLLFPRVGFGLFFHKQGPRVALPGLSERIQLGGHGRIVDDDTVMMRVKLDDERYRGVRAPEIHWRAVGFDRYHKGQWSRSTSGFATSATEVARLGGTSIVVVDQPGLAPARYGDEWRPGLTRQEVFLEPIDTIALLGASTPVGFEVPAAAPGQFSGRSPVIGRNGDFRVFRTGGIRYVVWSDTTSVGDARLRAAPDADPETMKPYLRPEDVPPAIAAEARRVTAGAKGPWEKVLAIESYLRQGFSYTLELDSGDDESRDPLEYFLFQRKKGHCEYFSSAMAVMLRAVGVPTRNVNGFLGGEWNEYGGYISVRAGDAHSWVEVWIDGIGWVTRDPTPPGSGEALSRGGGGMFDRLRRMVDTLRLKWFEWVIDYDLGRQMGLMKRVGHALGLEGGVSGAGVKRWLGRNKVAIGVAVALIAATIAIRRWLRRRRRGEEDEMPRRPRVPSHPVIALHTRVSRKLARYGFPRPQGQTPREHAGALADKGAPAADAYAELTELYYTVRFSESASIADSVDVDAARALATRIEDALRAVDRKAPPRQSPVPN